VIRGVIDFAGMIPGFQLLTQDDKFTLLKAGLFDALFVRLICMFDTSINSIICLNGQLMRRDSIQNGANARFLVDSTFNFAERMNSMQLTDAEIGLFCAIVLITPDRPGLRNVELIEKMYKKLKMCLQSIIQQNRPDKPDFLNDLLNTMPDLRTLSTLHTEKLVVFRTEHKELMRQQNLWQSGTNANYSAGSASSTASSSLIDDLETSSSKSPSPLVPNWMTEHTRTIVPTEPSCFDEIAKSPMGSVSSTESNDTGIGIGTIDYAHYARGPAAATDPSNHRYNQSIIIGVSSGLNSHHYQPQQTSSITSSAPLLAATLSGANCCPLRAQAVPAPPPPQTTTVTANSQFNQHRISNSSAEDDLSGNGATTTTISTSSPSGPSPQTITAIAGPPAAAVHLVQNGLTITPVLRQVPAQNPNAAASQMRYRKLDSPTDSGIESGNEKQMESGKATAVTTIVQSNNCNSNSSSCSSPRSSVDENLDHHMPHHHMYQQRQAKVAQTIDDMPVLKRVLQAPPLYDTNSLMDEAYKPHKKFRAMRHHTLGDFQKGDSMNGVTSPPPPNSSNSTPQTTPHHQSQLHMHLTRTQTNTTSTQQQLQQNSINSPAPNGNGPSVLSSTHSVLAKSLMEEPRMTPEQLKRSDIIQNYIMRGDKHSMYTNTKPKWCPPQPQQQQQQNGVITATHPHGSPTIKQEQRYVQFQASSTQNSFVASPPPSAPSTPAPRVIELKVDIASESGRREESAQPLNLSKKSSMLSPSSPSSSSKVNDEQAQKTVHNIMLEA
jgi:nuclear receptor subfamily 1 group D protein 3